MSWDESKTFAAIFGVMTVLFVALFAACFFHELKKCERHFPTEKWTCVMADDYVVGDVTTSKAHK